MTPLTRRVFLLVACLLAPGWRLRAHARAQVAGRPPAAVSVAEFLRVSQRLVGRTTLDAQAARTYLDALVAVPANVPLLADLAHSTMDAGPTPAHETLERTIIEWWYTGIYTDRGQTRLMTHTGALKWSALGMPAPGTCVRPFGAWAQPPGTQA
jgi:hypothetical protein